MAAKLVVVVAALAAAVCASPLPAFKGVLVTAQYRCDDFLCPDWELDVARVDPAFREHITTKLAMLIPKSPIAAMSFPVFTAYHEATRTFYTVGLPEAGQGTIWGAAIDAGVNTSTVLFSTRFVLPTEGGDVMRVHVSSNNSVYILFQKGTIYNINYKTGDLALVGTVVPANYSGIRVTGASTVDQSSDNLYSFFLSSAGPVMSRFNLRSGVVYSTLVIVKGVHWELENPFQAVWWPRMQQVIVLWAGIGDSGFDQIAAFDPITGQSKWINDNLAENNLFFTCDMNTKSCDILQTACYDAIEDRLYFQATEVTSQDDIGTTTLMYADLASKDPYIDTGLNPFTFGYMGFAYVPVLQ